MNDAMAHRGPDGEGYWETQCQNKDWGVLLAHRRLSILDLTPAGTQPMVDPATGHVIVFNGEIYNYLEIRTRLAAEGQRFQSTGDTAVILRALSLYGDQAIRWFRGMFAFALWDAREHKLALARDPLGIKPLYLARNPIPGGEWSLIFASEVRAILASGLLGKPRLNPRAVMSVVWNGFVVTPETAISGIEPVWPGQLRVFNWSGNEQQSKYHGRLPQVRDASPIDESQVAQVLEESVHLHLVSDVPVGVFLSGGVDSATVANLARRAHSSVNTFTLAFEEHEYNEAVVARQIADAIGTRHQEIVLTEQDFVDQLDAALGSLDQPTFDGLNSYYMSRGVRAAGFKVALVGTGGDELFGGYASFHDLPRFLRWLRHANWIPQSMLVELAKLVSWVLQPSPGAVPQQTRWAKLPEMVRCGDDLLALYQLAYGLFLPDFQRLLLDVARAEIITNGLPASMRSYLLSEIRSRSPLSAISLIEQRLFLGERLLRDTDSTSMASSIEIRLPLVDYILLENIDRLPDLQRYHPVGKKSVLRRAGLRGLDLSLFKQPKRGFSLPYDTWIRKGLRKVMDETMRDPAAVNPTGLNSKTVGRLWQAFLDGAPGLYWSRVWTIYVLILWCHRNKAFI
jgi:asparagine synthase (glutamine-hydrolysing)